ncbi:efflux RND transporter permease subunit [Akkermansiaceae bacterium]|nr:efflux RND transporter permease subunit [Akkermansiaceae bacterium]
MNPTAKNILAVIGGILVGGPVWFIALDLIVAYLPMAFIGGHLASRR